MSDPLSHAESSGRAHDAPVFALRRDAARALDRAAQEEYGVPSIVLMENAALALCAECLDALDQSSAADPLAVVCCGVGNNGGDGLALARHLHIEGVRTALLLVGAPENYTGDGAINARIVQRMGLPIVVLDAASPARTLDELSRRFGEPTLVVDALLGVGMDRPVRAPISAVVGWINTQREHGATVIAVDIPTGLDCDAGAPFLPSGTPASTVVPLDAVVRADVTVTFVAVKVGFLNASAFPYIGEVVVSGIGAPRELLERFGERVEIDTV